MKDQIAIISSSWHSDIVAICKQACLDELAAQKFDVSLVDSFIVPGSLEIPLTAQCLAETGRYAVILAMGLIVDGGIYRHDFVARAVIDGIVQVGLKTGIPILSAVLTPHHFHEHAPHYEFFRGHLKLKGTELASACLATLENINRIRELRIGDPTTSGTK